MTKSLKYLGTLLSGRGIPNKTRGQLSDLGEMKFRRAYKSRLADGRSSGCEKLTRDSVRFLDGEFGNVSEIGSTLGKCASYMKMEVRDSLVGGSPIVLPNRNPRPFEGVVYCSRRSSDGVNQRVAFVCGCFK